MARHPDFKPRVDSLLKAYLTKFDQNRDQYEREDGFNNKLVAALIAANYLQQKSNDPRLVDTYRRNGEEYKKTQAEVMDSSRW